MSLISDALKAAQRERDERTGRRSGAAVADEFFPHPAAKAPSEPHVTPKAAVVALIAALVVAGIVGIIVARFIARAIIERHHQHAPTHVQAPPHAVRPVQVPPPAVAAHASTSTTGDGQVEGPIAAARHDATPAPAKTTPIKTVVPAVFPSAPPARVAAQPPSRAAAHDSVKAAPKETPTAVISSQPPTVASITSPPTAGVRVIMDPAGTTPGDSLFAQAYAEHRRGNLDRAAGLYERALQAHESSPELYNDYGALLASRGNYTAAITMYRMGIAVDQQNAKLWLNLAEAYTTIGRHADALAAFSQLTQLDPLNATAKMRLAGEYQAIGDTASAHHGFEEATRLAPQDPTVHYAFGVFLQAQRDIDGAIRQYQLFVDNAHGEYPQAQIDEIKNHIAALRQFDRE